MIFAYSANETLAWMQGSGFGILTIEDNGTTENITLDGNYTQGEFALTNDATPSAGTDVVSVPERGCDGCTRHLRRGRQHFVCGFKCQRHVQRER